MESQQRISAAEADSALYAIAEARSAIGRAATYPWWLVVALPVLAAGLALAHVLPARGVSSTVGSVVVLLVLVSVLARQRAVTVRLWELPGMRSRLGTLVAVGLGSYLAASVAEIGFDATWTWWPAAVVLAISMTLVGLVARGAIRDLGEHG